MKKGLVSVVMSTCNTKDEYLALSVRSILEQTYKKIELILIVDGGEYNKFLSEMTDKRLRVVRHKNSLGLAARLNEGLSLAEGEYIARMDSDDYALPDRIEKQKQYMDMHRRVDICSMFTKNFGNNKKVRMSICTTNEYIQSELFLNCILVHPAIMFRASSIETSHIKYNEEYSSAQDFELWSRLIGKCDFVVLPEVGILYRIHNNQITINKKSEQEMRRDMVIRKNLNKLGFDAGYFKYVEALQGNISRNNVNDVKSFINKCLLRNDELKIFDKNALHNVLNRHLFTALLKKKHYLLCLKNIRFYDVYFILKTLFLTQKCNLGVLKYKKLYKKLIGEINVTN